MTKYYKKKVLLDNGWIETYGEMWYDGKKEYTDPSWYSVTLDQAYEVVTNFKVEITRSMLSNAETGLPIYLSRDVPSHISFVSLHDNNVLVMFNNELGYLEDYVETVWVKAEDYKQCVLNKIKSIFIERIQFITKFEFHKNMVSLNIKDSFKSAFVTLDPMPWKDKYILSEEDIYV